MGDNTEDNREASRPENNLNQICKGSQEIGLDVDVLQPGSLELAERWPFFDLVAWNIENGEIGKPTLFDRVGIDDVVVPKPEFFQSTEVAFLQHFDGFDAIASDIEHLQIGEWFSLQSQDDSRILVPI